VRRLFGDHFGLVDTFPVANRDRLVQAIGVAALVVAIILIVEG
jgi:hypothetical protein